MPGIELDAARKGANPVGMTEAATRRWLLYVARRALRDELTQRDRSCAGLPLPDVPRPDDPALRLPARLFVSWHDGPNLVGCIGTLSPWPELEAGVDRYARLAGVHDRRTPPASGEQWGRLHAEISLLGEPRELEVTGLPAIALALRPGKDGVILRRGDQSAFFLPVVWKTLPDPAAFLVALCRKAGLDPGLDGPHCTAAVMEAESWGEG